MSLETSPLYAGFIDRLGLRCRGLAALAPPETVGCLADRERQQKRNAMRIALVKRRYSLKVGGAERYCVNLARRLTAFGHEVTFIGESIDPELSHEVGFVPVK